MRGKTVSGVEENNKAKFNHMNSQITEVKTELHILKHEHVGTFGNGESTLNVALPPEFTTKTTKPDNIEDGIRISGIPESNSTDARLRYEHDSSQT